ncbi:MAG: citrate/2-methylcitrate synthase, partial [Thermoguttaceae bacterium]
MSDKAILTVGDQQIELPILEGTEGDRALDIAKLRDRTGLVTFDPSLGNTSLCRSAITFIDGEQGVLRYRGIPIEQFTDKPNFVEAAWMLIFGRLPKREELVRFSNLLTENELLHEGVKHQFQHIPPDAPPTAILSATLSHLACYHQELLALEDEESLEEAAARLISKVRTIAA